MRLVPLLLALPLLMAQSHGVIDDPIRPLVHQPEVQPEALSGPALSVRPAEPPEPPSAAEVERWRRQMVGKPVEDGHGRRLGTVLDLAMDADGAVAAVVVELPTRLIGVPWRAVRLQADAPAVVLPPIYYSLLAEDLRW